MKRLFMILVILLIPVFLGAAETEMWKAPVPVEPQLYLFKDKPTALGKINHYKWTGRDKDFKYVIEYTKITSPKALANPDMVIATLMNLAVVKKIKALPNTKLISMGKIETNGIKGFACFFVHTELLPDKDYSIGFHIVCYVQKPHFWSLLIASPLLLEYKEAFTNLHNDFVPKIPKKIGPRHTPIPQKKKQEKKKEVKNWSQLKIATGRLDQIRQQAWGLNFYQKEAGPTYSKDFTEKEYNAYRKYLHSPEWKAKADFMKEIAGNRCQVCDSTEYLCVHHRNYDNIGSEKITDLIVLCRDCHARYHEKGPYSKF